jgi:hypothetical protein
MFPFTRAMRRSKPLFPRRERRLPALAAVTVAALVALSAQGAGFASADEIAAPAAATATATAADSTAPMTLAGETPENSAQSAEEAIPAAVTAAEEPSVEVAPESGDLPDEAAIAAGGAGAEAAPEAEPQAGPGSDSEAAPEETAGPDSHTVAAEPAPEGILPSDSASGATPAPTPAPAVAGHPAAAGSAGDPAPASALLSDPAAIVNTPPVGVDDHYTLGVDTVLSVGAPGLLGNDIDAEGDFLTTTQGYTGTAQGGHVATKWDRSFEYTPAPGFVGTDSWTYRPQDEHGLATAITHVYFTVIGTTDAAPTAHDDSYTATSPAGLVVSGTGVLANDTDPEGDTLQIAPSLVAGGVLPTQHGGLVEWSATGGFIYAAQAGFTGFDTFTYWASDGVLDSYLATVTVKVGDWTNLPPVAHDDQYTTASNHLLSVDAAHGLLANDTDADDALSVIVPFMLYTGRGSVQLHSDGSFTYSSSYYDTLGPDTFTYQVTDGSYNLPVTATVTIDVTAFANAAPTTVDDHYATTVGAGFGAGKSTGLLANDSDADQDQLHATGQIDAATDKGGIVNVGDNGSFSYTPPAGFVGVDHFTYEANDGWVGGVATGDAFVIITDPNAVGGTNSMPVAADDHYSALPDTTLVVSGADGVLGNDFDADGDPLSTIIPALPYGSATVEGGTVTGTSDGGFTYSPPAGFVGDDEFVYHVMDQAVESYDIGTVRITVALPGTTVPGAETPGTVPGTDPAGDPTADPTSAGGGTETAGASGTSATSGSDPAGSPRSDEEALALTGAEPDGTLTLALFLLLAGALGIAVAAVAHRRSREF